MANITRPKATQVKFRSIRTGNHILDTYLEACEKGDTTLPALLDQLYTEDGLINPDAFEFRVTDQNVLQARIGAFLDPAVPWVDVQPFFRQRGAHADATEYALLDVVTNGDDTYVCTVPHTSSGAINLANFSQIINGTIVTTRRNEAEAARDLALDYRNQAEGFKDDAAASAGNALTSETNAAATLEDFQGRYYGANAGPPATDPNGDPATEGDLFFDTLDNSMKVYDGANWIQASSVIEGVFDVTEFTNVQGQTLFNVVYDVGLLNVYYNGVLLRPSDYTANNGTSVTLASAVTAADDVVSFQAWGAVTESATSSMLNAWYTRRDNNLSDVADVPTTRTNLGLGTAATEDVTTSAADTTVGRLLAVRDFGIGSRANAPVVLDLNSFDNGAGIYTIGGETTGTFPPGLSGGQMIHSTRVVSAGVQQAFQLAWRDASAQYWMRSGWSGTWQPWRQIYHQGSILGTVSQSGGVPTGAIIERGSNGNGEFVKFADGTMVCWKTGHSISNESTGIFRGDWTFPATFVNSSWHAAATIPIGGTTAQNEFRRACSRIAVYGASGTSAVVRATTFTTAVSPLAFPDDTYVEDVVTLTAIGRWY